MELPTFADEAALFDWAADKLYSAVLSDACDAMGHRDRALAPDIRPLDESQVLVGRAKTVVWGPTFHVSSQPYEKEIAAVDSLRPGEVFVMARKPLSEIVPWASCSPRRPAKGGRGRSSTAWCATAPDQGDEAPGLCGTQTL
jgi:hypothetical protein